jgi:hypothetical protein
MGGENKKMNITGRTWPDLVASMPLWIIALASLVFVFLIAISLLLEKQVEVGFIGKIGPVASSGATATLMPIGAVVAFDGECPENLGWTRFNEANARFIVGAASKDQLDAGPAAFRFGNNGIPLSPRQQKSASGTETVKLEIAHMPSHSHRVSTGMGINWHNGFAGSDATYGIDQIFNRTVTGLTRDHGHGIFDRVLERTGEGVPHDNMPPYIALNFCVLGK